MSDITPIRPIKLDMAARKRLDDAMAQLEGLEKQSAALEKLGITMPFIKQQIEWSKKAYETLKKDFM